jgi:hypothetical protein
MLKPPISEEGWAEVRARDRVVRYRRTGTGPIVLLLAHEDTRLRDGLVRAMSENFRLLDPDISETEIKVAECLAEFLEGLGTTTVNVVAVGRFCIPALELALRDGDQIGRVVLIPDGEECEAASEGAIATTSRRVSMPLLIVRGVAPTAVLPLVTQFLREGQTSHSS